jgi:hypothetical protein
MTDGFREHGVMLFLSKDLYTAFIKLQADKGLGRSYAGLLPFTEGMYHLGYLTKAVYDVHVEKYSIPLVQDKASNLVALQEKQEIETKNLFFKQVLEQWTLHTDSKWHEKMVKQAEPWKDKLESAKKICELVIVKEVS